MVGVPVVGVSVDGVSVVSDSVVGVSVVGVPVVGAAVVDMNLMVSPIEGFGPNIGQLEIPIIALGWRGVDHQCLIGRQFPHAQPHAHVRIPSHDAMLFDIGKVKVVDGCLFGEFHHPIGKPLSAAHGIEGGAHQVPRYAIGLKGIR